jgi:pseudaminic acid cytidylyltransferase
MANAAIAIIPARGGSKRIPGKNIRSFSGKPMIAYTIAAACESGLFDRVVVSTDSEGIAEVALQFGAEVPFLRDANLADDFTPVSSVTADALVRLDPTGDRFAVVAQLMPCCPLRTACDVCDSYREFEKSGAESQISMVRYGWQNPWWAMRRNDQHELEPVFSNQMSARSQDQPELFCPTGAIWWAKAEFLRRTKNFHLGNRMGWEIPWQKGIDIDTFQDWAMAEVLFRLPAVQGENDFDTRSITYQEPDAAKADRPVAECVNPIA